MKQKTQYYFHLLLLLTAGFLALFFSTEPAQAKVKTTIKNGVCTVSGKGAMTDDKSYNKKIKKVIIKEGITCSCQPQTKKKLIFCTLKYHFPLYLLLQYIESNIYTCRRKECHIFSALQTL